jgi:hypothetical protein
MKKPFFVCLMILLATVAGCANEPPTVGKATELKRVCDRSNDGERVAVEGYLTLPERISDDDATISVLLEIRPSESVENMTGRVGVWTEYGNEANQVAHIPYTTELPKSGNYTHADLKVTTNDGQKITYTDRVRVSGRVRFPSSPEIKVISPCVLNNPLVERIE